MAGVSAYDYLRDTIGESIYDSDWATHQKYYDQAQNDYDNGVRNEQTINAADKLAAFFHKHQDKLNPTQLQEMHSMLTQNDNLDYLIQDAKEENPDFSLSKNELGNYLDSHYTTMMLPRAKHK
jgi:hypothetical protein